MNAKLRVVIDTNVVVSALWKGSPWEIMLLLQEGTFHAVVCGDMLNEYKDVLKRFKLPESDIEQFLSVFYDSTKSMTVYPQKSCNVITEDPSDNIFLDCAVCGKADYVISGDKHLLKLKKYHNISIINPAGFLRACPT